MDIDKYIHLQIKPVNSTNIWVFSLTIEVYSIVGTLVVATLNISNYIWVLLDL